MQFEKWYDVDLAQPRQFIPDLGFPLFKGDDNSVKIGVNLYHNKQPINVTGTVKGYATLPSGAMIEPWTTGNGKEDNKCWIVIPANALVLQGRILTAIKLDDTNEDTVIFAATATVRRIDSDALYDPDDIVPTWDDILEKIEDMDEAAEACETAAENADNAVEYIAPAESTTTASQAYAAGDYLIYNGTLYEVTTAIASGGTITTSGSGQNVTAVSGGLSAECSFLKKDVSDNASMLKLSEYQIGKFESGYFSVPKVGNTLTPERVASQAATSVIMAVSPGDILRVNVTGAGTSTSGAIACAILDSNYSVITRDSSNTVHDNSVIPISRYNAAYVVVNNVTASQANPYLIKTPSNKQTFDKTVSNIIGEDTLFVTEYDSAPWIAKRIYGTTGATNTSQSVNIIRGEFVDEAITEMYAPDNVLAAFLYTMNGTYIGGWVETSETVVKATSGFTKRSVLNFDRMRLAYPGCKIIVQSTSDTIGDDTTYPAEHFSIKIRKTNTVKELQDSTYEQIPLNLGDWLNSAIVSNGSIGWSETNLMTQEYVPDYWMKLNTTAGHDFAIAAYNHSGQYVGQYQINSGFSESVGDILYGIDLEALRKAYPLYWFRIFIHGNELQQSIAGVGTITIDVNRRQKIELSDICYNVPNRFTRETIYHEDLSSLGYDNPSMQGLCTDGTYLYGACMAVNGSDSPTSTTLLRKIDTSGNLIASNAVVGIGHCNDMAYDPNNNLVLAVGRVGGASTTIFRIDPATLELDSTIDVSEIFSAVNAKTYLQGEGLSMIAYYAEVDAFIIGCAAWLAVVDSTFTNVMKIIQPFKALTSAQFVYPMGNEYLFMGLLDDHYEVEAYDWHGNYITGFDVPVGHGLGYSELEGICKIGDTWYCSWNSSITKFTITEGTEIGNVMVSASKCLKQFNFGY